MARAILSASILLAGTSVVRAEGRLLPEQAVGIAPRFGGGLLIGEGVDQTSPSEWSYGGALMIRLSPQAYLELGFDSKFPVVSEPPLGKSLVGIGQQTAGIRLLRPWSERVRTSAGGGLGFARVGTMGDGPVWSGSGPMVQVYGGMERQLTFNGASASYVGVEGTYQHYFPQESARFRGGMVELRLTFSYYLGGDEISDCM